MAYYPTPLQGNKWMLSKCTMAIQFFKPSLSKACQWQRRFILNWSGLYIFSISFNWPNGFCKSFFDNSRNLCRSICFGVFLKITFHTVLLYLWHSTTYGSQWQIAINWTQHDSNILQVIDIHLCIYATNERSKHTTMKPHIDFDWHKVSESNWECRRRPSVTELQILNKLVKIHTWKTIYKVDNLSETQEHEINENWKLKFRNSKETTVETRCIPSSIFSKKKKILKSFFQYNDYFTEVHMESTPKLCRWQDKHHLWNANGSQ